MTKAKDTTPKLNEKCEFCYGAWNGMDRWFMQDCICVKPGCIERKCKAREDE